MQNCNYKNKIILGQHAKGVRQNVKDMVVKLVKNVSISFMQTHKHDNVVCVNDLHVQT